MSRKKRGLRRGQNTWWPAQKRLYHGEFGSIADALAELKKEGEKK